MQLRVKAIAIVAMLTTAGAPRDLFAEEGEAHELGQLRDDPLAKAREALQQAQFGAAKTSLKEALVSGRLGPSMLVELYRLQGETLAAMGDDEGAKTAFRALIALSPEVALTELVSPKITAVFDLARASLEGRFLDVDYSTTPQARRLTLRIASDPLAMASGVHLSYVRQDGSSGELVLVPTKGVAIFDVPEEAETDLKLLLKDPIGNTLRSWSVPAMPALPALPAQDAAGPVIVGRPLYKKWWMWAGAAGALGLGGVVLGLTSRNAQHDLDDILASPEAHFYSEAKRLEDKARSTATMANIAYAGAAGLAAVGAAFYISEDRASEQLSVAPTARGDGVSLWYGARF